MFTAINLAFIAGESALERVTRQRLLLAAGLAAAVAFFIHTRSIVVLLVVWLAWWLSGLGLKLRRNSRFAALALLLALSIALVLHIVADRLLESALDPYVSSGVQITIGVGLLAALALCRYPRPALSALLTTVLLLAALTVPSPLAAAGTLLDRPLVEMLLFAPLAMLGGLGFAGFAASLRQRHPTIVRATVLLLAAGVVMHAFARYSFRPSTCCSLVAKEDLLALEWIEGNLPREAHVAISAAPVRAAPAAYPAMDAPADAGAWITPLVGRASSRFSDSVDFSEASTLAGLCERRLTDIYAGSAAGSFDIDTLQAKPEWYRLDLDLSNVRIYHVIGCMLPG
jgi:hypothetical protein